MEKTIICNDIAIVYVEGNDYRISKNEAINIMKNLDIWLLITDYWLDCCWLF